jgi:hypothetical protein
MPHLQRIRSRPLVVAGTCGVVILAAAAADAARAATLDLTSGAATSLTTVDLGTPGATMGDVFLFESPVLSGGQLLGAQTTIGAWRHSRNVQSALTFDLPDGQLAVAGVSQTDAQPLGLLTGRPMVRAVVGGSGAYAGMRGTVTSTRRPDGTYTQAFALAAPVGSTRTVNVVSTSGPGRQIDVPEPGNSPGDTTIVDDAVLRDAQDAIIGTVRGVQQVVSTTGGRVVQAQLTYTLPDGELLVGGISRQVLDGTGLLVGTTFVRPVLGGTGAYAGAGGTMTTSLDAGGRYQQRFDLSGIGAPVTQTVRLIADDAEGRTERIDQPTSGVSAGDETAYSGPLRNASGKRRVGTARGVQTTVAVENGMQTVSSQLTYAMRGRGTLVVGGLSRYPAAGTTGTVRGALPERPVLGGTGDFAGAHGVLRTVRTRTGSYRLTFSLSGAPSRKR